MRRYSLLLFFSMLCKIVLAQDIHYSQITSSKQLINPALTGSMDENLKLETKYRSQLFTTASTYNTSSIALDAKIPMPNKVTDDVLAVGGMVLLDNVNNGVFRTTQVTLNAAYHKVLGSNYQSKSILSFGTGVTYGESKLDYSLLSFDQQFDFDGFNLSLPTGEPTMLAKTANFSVSTGLLYSRIAESYRFSFGVAGYHLNEPKQSILNDANQKLSKRLVYYSDLGINLNPGLVLNVSAMHQSQAKSAETIIGSYLSFNMTDRSTLKFGVFDRINESIIPYFGFRIGKVALDITYDVNTGAWNSTFTRPKSFELCLKFNLSKQESSVF